MRYFWRSLLCWCLSGQVWAQDFPLVPSGPGVKTVVLVQSFPCNLRTPPGEATSLFFWSYPAGVVAIDKGEQLEIAAAPQGEVIISVKEIAAKLDKDGKFQGFLTRRGFVTLIVGELPTPKPPDPPKPPEPPTPKPTTGVKVLILEESKDRTTAHAAIVFSKVVRDYLNAKCAFDADGKTKAWTIQDKDTDLSGYFKGWADLQARPRQGLPWVIIADAKNVPVFEGALPTSVEATLGLLKKHLEGGGS